VADSRDGAGWRRLAGCGLDPFTHGPPVARGDEEGERGAVRDFEDGGDHVVGDRSRRAGNGAGAEQVVQLVSDADGVPEQVCEPVVGLCPKVFHRPADDGQG
jgi:hypothetical protein